MQIPYRIRNLPDFVQRAWVKEFETVLERCGSAITAVMSADSLVESWRARNSIVEVDDERSQHVVGLKASICELTEARARDIIPESVLTKIKAEHENPFLTLFEIGTPGLSTGEGIRKIWSFSAIKELGRKIGEGIADIFYSHSESKSRKSLGKVVWGYAKEVGHELKAFAVGLITDKTAQENIKSGVWDLCSIEAEVEFNKKGSLSDWFIEKVTKVTALILANSAIDTPGFTSAGPVAIIKELERKGSTMVENNKTNKTVMDSINIYEVKVAIEKNAWTPEQLFRKEDLLALPIVQDCIKAESDKARKESQDKIKQLTEQLTPLQKRVSEETVIGFVDKSSLLTDKKTGCRQFITSKLKGLSLDGVEEGLKQSKVDEAIKVELEGIKTLGITFADKAETETDETETEETETEASTSASKKKIDRKDMTRSWASGGGNKQIPDED